MYKCWKSQSFKQKFIFLTHKDNVKLHNQDFFAVSQILPWWGSKVYLETVKETPTNLTVTLSIVGNKFILDTNIWLSKRVYKMEINSKWHYYVIQALLHSTCTCIGKFCILSMAWVLGSGSSLHVELENIK